MFRCVPNGKCCPKPDGGDDEIPFTTFFDGQRIGPQATPYAFAFARSSSFVMGENSNGGENGQDENGTGVNANTGFDTDLIYDPTDATVGEFCNQDCDDNTDDADITPCQRIPKLRVTSLEIRPGRGFMATPALSYQYYDEVIPYDYMSPRDQHGRQCSSSATFHGTQPQARPASALRDLWQSQAKIKQAATTHNAVGAPEEHEEVFDAVGVADRSAVSTPAEMKENVKLTEQVSGTASSECSEDASEQGMVRDTSISVLTRLVEKQEQGRCKPLTEKWKDRIIDT